MTQAKTPIPMVDCPTCDGRGKIQIPKHLSDVLNIIRRRGKATSADVLNDKAFKDHVVPTAVNNRLDDLLRLELVTRVKDGKAWVWSCK